MLQVITFQRRIICVEIREFNLQALAQRRENSAATSQVLPSDTDLAAPLRSQSYAKPKCIGPRNCRNGKYPETMIQDFRAVLDNPQDATHRVSIYRSTREFIKHESSDKTYISDDQVHTMELCISHGKKVQVEGLDGERISQMCRCTGSHSSHGGDRRNDWVRVKERPGKWHGALTGRLPW